MKEIIVERHGSWAEIIFNRPERRNAINYGFGLGLRDALRTLNAKIKNDKRVDTVLVPFADGIFMCRKR